MEPWLSDALKITSAIAGILILAFSFLFFLICIPWKRCRRVCKRDVEAPEENLESQRPPPYYSLITQLLTIPSSNSPPLPTYEECTQETLPPRFEETVDAQIVTQLHTPSQTTSHSNRFHLWRPGQTRTARQFDHPQRQGCCPDMCIHCSIPASPPSTPPPPVYVN